MHLVTWNCCRGAYAKKAPLLDVLMPDVAVIQECAKPPIESETCLWFGDNPRQGIAIQAAPPYQLRRLPMIDGVPKYIVPVSVSGPVDFTLLAVWSKGDQPYRYVEAVVKAVEMYRSLFMPSPTVLIGDLNSNCIWDASHPRDLNHSALVKLMSSLGLVSAYHSFYGEAHGRETTPTYFFQWKEERPYHIDYCFIPEAWASNVRRVEIGKYDEWKQHSDHRPLLIEIAHDVASNRETLPVR
jgi:hypothetical protein